jgi:lipopolysaccharide transport system permease protein
MIVLVLLLLFLWVSGCGIGVAYAALPLLLLIQGTFILGLSFLMAGIVPFLPDLRIVLGHIFHLLFFLSGILFSIDVIPERLHLLFRLNPMATLIISYREVLIHNRWPDFAAIGMVAAASIVLVILGAALIKHFDRIYPKIS